MGQTDPELDEKAVAQTVTRTEHLNKKKMGWVLIGLPGCCLYFQYLVLSLFWLAFIFGFCLLQYSFSFHIFALDIKAIDRVSYECYYAKM